MFSTTGLFRGIPCPEGEKCAIIHCIFSHELRPEMAIPAATEPLSRNAMDEPEQKRRKLNSTSEQPHMKHPVAPQSSSVPKIGSYKGPTASSPVTVSSQQQQALQKPSLNPPRTLQKVVTPPPLQNPSKASVNMTKGLPVAKPETKESLNPRRIPHDPAGHAKRMIFLKHIHEEMKRLNAGVTKGDHSDKEVLTLSDNELIKAALDEEEQIARANANVYPNIIKNRIMALKKMKTDDWVKHVLTTFAKTPVPVLVKPEITVVTGLTPAEEPLFLEHMLTDQAPLVRHGYVPTPPTEAEIAEAKAGVAASLNYEVCDRCKSRFRVYPDRREEDGALTTNGPCTYHWARPVYPKREKTDAIKGARETVYGCCGEILGTKGCTEMPTHVFKIDDPKRLASVLPFINTPENSNPAKGPNGKVPAAITFDCEMGYTVCGFELMRLTAVTWPEGDAIIDVLVRPQGAILDFNTRFSGISPEAWNSAIPHRGVSHGLDSLLPPPPPGSKPSSPDVHGTGPMPIVDSPAAARDLLCSYITPSTPLLGHALENDLNVVRLCHPRIVDTVALFPHPRGLPIRFGLKMLTKTRLNRDIQMGGANGHDSLEDARATGELVRYVVKKRWTEMKNEGWKIERGVLMPPLPGDLPPPPEGEQERVLGGGAGVKRQRIQVSTGESDDAKKQKL